MLSITANRDALARDMRNLYDMDEFQECDTLTDTSSLVTDEGVVDGKHRKKDKLNKSITQTKPQNKHVIVEINQMLAKKIGKLKIGKNKKLDLWRPSQWFKLAKAKSKENDLDIETERKPKVFSQESMYREESIYKQSKREKENKSNNEGNKPNGDEKVKKKLRFSFVDEKTYIVKNKVDEIQRPKFKISNDVINVIKIDEEKEFEMPWREEKLKKQWSQESIFKNQNSDIGTPRKNDEKIEYQKKIILKQLQQRELVINKKQDGKNVNDVIIKPIRRQIDNMKEAGRINNENETRPRMSERNEEFLKTKIIKRYDSIDATVAHEVRPNDRYLIVQNQNNENLEKRKAFENTQINQLNETKYSETELDINEFIAKKKAEMNIESTSKYSTIRQSVNSSNQSDKALTSNESIKDEYRNSKDKVREIDIKKPYTSNSWHVMNDKSFQNAASSFDISNYFGTKNNQQLSKNNFYSSNDSFTDKNSKNSDYYTNSHVYDGNETIYSVNTNNLNFIEKNKSNEQIYVNNENNYNKNFFNKNHINKFFHLSNDSIHENNSNLKNNINNKKFNMSNDSINYIRSTNNDYYENNKIFRNYNLINNNGISDIKSNSNDYLNIDRNNKLLYKSNESINENKNKQLFNYNDKNNENVSNFGTISINIINSTNKPEYYGNSNRIMHVNNDSINDYNKNSTGVDTVNKYNSLKRNNMKTNMSSYSMNSDMSDINSHYYNNTEVMNGKKNQSNNDLREKEQLHYSHDQIYDHKSKNNDYFTNKASKKIPYVSYDNIADKNSNSYSNKINDKQFYLSNETIHDNKNKIKSYSYRVSDYLINKDINNSNVSNNNNNNNNRRHNSYLVKYLINKGNTQSDNNLDNNDYNLIKNNNNNYYSKNNFGKNYAKNSGSDFILNDDLSKNKQYSIKAFNSNEYLYNTTNSNENLNVINRNNLNHLVNTSPSYLYQQQLPYRIQQRRQQ